jgi:pimeloyl-ACP methyl ester carboxylesterase
MAPLRAAVAALGLWLGGAGMAAGQSTAGDEMFDPQRVVDGIEIDRPDCDALSARHTAVWVDGACLRYYAAGLRLEAANPVVAAWLNGDVLGPHGNDARRRQSGFGPAAVIAQEAGLAARHGIPFIFLGRPGTYGSAGKHHALRGRPREAALVDAMLDALKQRYRIDAWALGGHSGGGTLVAAMLARRSDLRCAVISSGAASYRSYLEARGLLAPGAPLARFDPYDALDRVPRDPARRIFVIGDPRETNVPFSSQRQYYEGLRQRSHAAWLVPLERATDARRHGLVDFGETATGLCGAGAPTEAIVETLVAMPPQGPRLTN